MLVQDLIYVLLRMVRRMFGFFSVKSHFKLAALLPYYMKLGLEKLGCERV